VGPWQLLSSGSTCVTSSNRTTSTNPVAIYAKHKPFTDCYFEMNANDDVFLRESGFDEFPVMAFRWEVCAGDVYGTIAPA
jgi:hypothetical protein